MPDRKEIRRLVKAGEGWPGWRVETTKAGWML
jgi:hypothetical protein